MASEILGEGIWLFKLYFLLVFSSPLAAHLLMMWDEFQYLEFASAFYWSQQISYVEIPDCCHG